MLRLLEKVSFGGGLADTCCSFDFCRSFAGSMWRIGEDTAGIAR